MNKTGIGRVVLRKGVQHAAATAATNGAAAGVLLLGEKAPKASSPEHILTRRGGFSECTRASCGCCCCC